MTEPVTFRYRAFLSYSHRDTAWAKWLHAALEGYRIDKDLAGRATPAGPVPKTLRPIFRDREDFSAGHSLTEQTAAALETSRFMVVLCSPNAARSPYVNEEIRRFKALGCADRIIPLIIGGEPGDTEQDLLPAGAPLQARAPTAPERRAGGADRERMRGRRNDGKDIAKIKLIAGLLGLGFDEIVRREERARRRRHRILGAIAATFIFLAVTATGSAVYAFNKLVESEENLDHAVEFAYGFVSEAAAEADRYGVSVETTLKLLRRAEQALDAPIQARPHTPATALPPRPDVPELRRNYQKSPDQEPSTVPGRRKRGWRSSPRISRATAVATRSCDRAQQGRRHSGRPRRACQTRSRATGRRSTCCDA